MFHHVIQQCVCDVWCQLAVSKMCAYTYATLRLFNFHLHCLQLQAS